MTHGTRTADSPHTTYGTPGLWAGVLGAPMAWALQMQLMYMLVPWVCRNDAHWALHAVTVVAALIGVVCGVLSWLDWRRARGVPSGDAGGPVGRTWFLGVLGLMSSALFTLVIVAQGAASFFIDPCQH